MSFSSLCNNWICKEATIFLWDFFIFKFGNGRANSHLEFRLKNQVTESQNGWKGPLETIWSNTLLKQGHPEQTVKDHIEAAFKDLQGWRTHSLWAACDNAPSCCMVIKCFLVFRQNVSCSENSIAPSSLRLPLRYLYMLIRFSSGPPLLQNEQSQFSQPLLMGEMFQSLDGLGVLLLDFFQYVFGMDSCQQSKDLLNIQQKWLFPLVVCQTVCCNCGF